MLAYPQGIHFKLSNLPDVVARFSNGSVNTPNYDAFLIDILVSEFKFEAAVYELLRSDASSILASFSTTVPGSSMYLSGLKFLKILLVADCSCSKGHKERI